jgi:hypothetical protein
MGSNPTQALGIICTFVAFVLLAGTFAGGGILCGIGALVALGIGAALFMKAKPWEHRGEEPNGSMKMTEVRG